MKKVLAMAGVALSPLALVLATALPKVAVLLLSFFPGGIAAILTLVIPILVIGILGLLGTTVSDSILFIL